MHLRLSLVPKILALHLPEPNIGMAPPSRRAIRESLARSSASSLQTQDLRQPVVHGPWHALQTTAAQIVDTDEG